MLLKQLWSLKVPLHFEMYIDIHTQAQAQTHTHRHAPVGVQPCEAATSLTRPDKSCVLNHSLSLFSNGYSTPRGQTKTHPNCTPPSPTTDWRQSMASETPDQRLFTQNLRHPSSRCELGEFSPTVYLVVNNNINSNKYITYNTNLWDRSTPPLDPPLCHHI